MTVVCVNRVDCHYGQEVWLCHHVALLSRASLITSFPTYSDYLCFMQCTCIADITTAHGDGYHTTLTNRLDYKRGANSVGVISKPATNMQLHQCTYASRNTYYAVPSVSWNSTRFSAHLKPVSTACCTASTQLTSRIYSHAFDVTLAYVCALFEQTLQSGLGWTSEHPTHS